MKIDDLLPQTQDGLRQWARDVQGNAMAWDDTASAPERWAWFWFQLRKSENRPEWFPTGKWATLQRIREMLGEEARKALTQQLGFAEINDID
jgi:hypothetical protein